jgi:amidase
MAEPASTPTAFKMAKLNGVDLYEITINQIQNCFEHGQFTSADYVRYCLDRIRKVTLLTLLAL